MSCVLKFSNFCKSLYRCCFREFLNQILINVIVSRQFFVKLRGVKKSTTVKPTRLQKVRIRTVMRSDGTPYWVIRCRKSGIPEKLQYQAFDDFQAAVAEAQRLEDLIVQGKSITDTEEVRHVIKKIGPKIVQITEQYGHLDLDKLFDEAINWEVFMRQVERHKQSLGLPFHGPVGERNMIFHSYYNKMLPKAVGDQSLWEISIKYIQDKFDSGRKSFSPFTKTSTKNHLNTVKKVMQRLTLNESSKRIRNDVIRFLDDAVATSNRQKGKPYTICTKQNICRDLNTFGKWIQTNYPQIDENIFNGINSVYQNSKFRRVKTFSNEEVKRIFKLASTERRYRPLLPYLTLIFFATVRPYEVRDPANKKRSLDWSAFKNWKMKCKVLEDESFYLRIVPVKNVEGKEIRMSKVAMERNALLLNIGYKWLKYAFNNELPITGPIYLSRKKFDAFKTATGLSWDTDKARHTLLSHCRANEAWRGKASDGFWCDVACHNNNTFKKHYKDFSDPDENTAFFNLTPENVLGK